jgi:hypothetical protein
MAIRDDFTAGEVLAAADLNDTFGAKLDLAGGKVLQIVRATDTTNRTTTSATLVDVTGMSVTITPQKSDSAILLLSNFSVDMTGTPSTYGNFAITDSSNNAISGAQNVAVGLVGSTIRNLNSVVLVAWATPATTSATTYKLRFRRDEAGTTVQVNNALATGQLFAIEVSA